MAKAFSRYTVLLGLALTGGAAVLLAIAGAVPAVHKLPPAVALAEVSAQRCETEAAHNPQPAFAPGPSAYCFSGEIDRSSADAFLAKAIPDNATVFLDSTGGDAESALDMADYIAAHKLNVVVSQYCLSSCANYLFVAGKRKIVLPDSFLGFHGGPHVGSHVVNQTSMPLAEVAARVNVMAVRLIARQDAFYRRIGFDGSIIYKPPYQASFDDVDWSHTFWEVGPTLLSQHYGVQGIDFFATPGSGSPIQALRAVILRGVSCKGIGADAWLCQT